MSQSEPLPPEDTFRLREYLGVLRLRKWSILLVAFVAVSSALFYSQKQTPIYTSSVTVIATDPLAPVFSNGGTTRGPDMGVEASLVTSLPVAQCATQILRHPEQNKLNADLGETCSADATDGVVPEPGLRKTVTVTVPQTTGAEASSLLVISYSDPVPATAQSRAQAFALAYQHYKLTQAAQQLNERAAPIQVKLTALTKQLGVLNGQIADILASTDPDPLALSAHEQQRQTVQQQIATYQQQLLEISPTKIDPPQIPGPAPLPVSPSSPNKLLNAGVGLLAGLAIGVGLAFLRERLDDRLRGRIDLEERAGAPVLAVIPKVSGWKRKQETKLVALDQPKGAATEAYRTLRTSVLFASLQRGVKTIMVVSPSAGEGKTTTAVNLSVVLADTGKRVILLSADLRKPRVHQFFRLPNDVGLANVLAGDVKPWDALRSPNHIDNLRVLTSGPVPAGPAELLHSEHMRELISELREVADFVVIDTPPILLVADPLALAPLVDGVLFVAAAGETTRSAVAHSREQLEQVDVRMIGAVLNNFDPSKARGYGYYGYGAYRYRYAYEYGYGHPRDGGEARRRTVLEQSESRNRGS